MSLADYEEIAVLGASEHPQTSALAARGRVGALANGSGRATGAGALATVSLVLHRGSKKYFAMKRMDKKKILKMKQLEHIHHEKNLLKEVDHPFIVGL